MTDRKLERAQAYADRVRRAPKNDREREEYRRLSRPVDRREQREWR